MGIEINKVSFAYGKGKHRHEVLHDVSFSVKEGELAALLGANGVGKSTLFKCILGILEGYEGSIGIDGENAARMSAGRLAKKIAYIPQLHYPAFNYSVLNMVLMGTGGQLSVMSAPGRKEIELSYEALDKMGIAGLAQRGFNSLSGGEQQLVLMARALAQNAGIWILDEPVANLDYGNQIMVQERLMKLAREGYTLLMSTHNPEQSFIFADRIVAMKDGRVLADDIPGEVIKPELIRSLYGTDVVIDSLYGDKVRVCVPGYVFKGR